MTTARKILSNQAFDDPQALLEAFKARDQRAIAEVYRQHVKGITRLVQRVLGPDNECDDLVQEAFMCAIEGAAGFRGDASNFGAWLNQIAVMRVRQRIRKRRLRRWLSFREPEAMPERVSSVGQPAERLALSRAYHILGQLNADDRIVFGLRFIDRQSIPEIAELCKISCATVKRRLTHADARFRLLAGKDMILRDWLVGEVEL